jgi:3'-phosphoadenosine 5'-phosphosulfate (PAPS) 3'-phosphatase
VQIGLAINGEVVAGVVYQPERDVLYRASRGGGSWIETADHRNERMTVSNVTDPGEMILASSRSHPSPRMERVRALLRFKSELRRGSTQNSELRTSKSGVTTQEFNDHVQDSRFKIQI